MPVIVLTEFENFIIQLYGVGACNWDSGDSFIGTMSVAALSSGDFTPTISATISAADLATVPAGASVVKVTVDATHDDTSISGAGNHFFKYAFQGDSPINWDDGREINDDFGDRQLYINPAGFYVPVTKSELAEYRFGWLWHLPSSTALSATNSVSAFSVTINYAIAITLDPDHGSMAGGTAVTITCVEGTFVTDSTVTFDGVPATDVVFVDSTHITCVTPAHAEGLVTVNVIDPDDLVAGIGAYTYEGLSIDPEISDTPGGETATITGHDFEEGMTVAFGLKSDDTPNFAADIVIVDPLTLTCTIPSHDIGTIEVTVTWPDESFETVPFAYYVFPYIEPAGGPLAGGTVVAITRWWWEEGDGTEFVEGATITFDGVPATEITFVDVNHYTCKSPAHATGLVQVNISDISSLGLNMEYPDRFGYGDTTRAPKVNAGIDKKAVGPAPSTVFVLGTIDTAGDFTFIWSQVSGPSTAVISSPTTLSTNIIFNTYVPGVYLFRLTAQSEIMPPFFDEMTITLEPVRTPRVRITGSVV